MSTLNNVVLFVLVLFVLSVGSVACDFDDNGGGSTPTGPSTTPTPPATPDPPTTPDPPALPVDDPGPEPYWYDDTLYHQLVYDADERYRPYDTSYVLDDPRGYDFVFSRTDPGGRCTITDDTITLGNGNRHTFHKLFNFALRHDGETSSPFWMIYDDPSQARWTGRLYFEENARKRPGRFVVRFSSRGLPNDITNTAGASATLGDPAPEIVFYYDNYNRDYDCALRAQTLAAAANILLHEVGHTLGFHHVSGSLYPESLMQPIYQGENEYSPYFATLTSNEQFHMIWAYKRGRNARRKTGWPGGIPVGFSGLQRPAYPVRLPPIVIHD